MHPPFLLLCAAYSLDIVIDCIKIRRVEKFLQLLNNDFCFSYIMHSFVFSYVLLRAFSSIIAILDFAWIDISYVVLRLTMIYIYTKDSLTFKDAVITEIIAAVGVWYFGSYTFFFRLLESAFPTATPPNS